MDTLASQIYPASWLGTSMEGDFLYSNTARGSRVSAKKEQTSDGGRQGALWCLKGSGLAQASRGNEVPLLLEVSGYEITSVFSLGNLL